MRAAPSAARPRPPQLRITPEESQTARVIAGEVDLQYLRAVLLECLLIELDAEARCVVEVENALFDAGLPIVDLEPERIAIGVGERLQDVTIGNRRQEMAVQYGFVVRRHLDVRHRGHVGALAPLGDSSVRKVADMASMSYIKMA